MSRGALSDEQFRQESAEAIRQFSRREISEDVLTALLSSARYVTGSFGDPEAYARLDEVLRGYDEAAPEPLSRVFYLSTAPSFFPVIIEQLGQADLTSCAGGVRCVIEKPFGTSLAEARQLNRDVLAVLSEDQVFRIDHYLGKETVQNLLALRFANQMFEPVWNANYVDHVQITMAEDIGIGGRAGYYDGIGAARDVIQNHLLQLLAFTAMEEPVSFRPDELQTEKVKVLSATKLVEPLAETTSRGQYAAGWQGGEQVVGLLDEEGFAKDSTTETFAAITLAVDTPVTG